MHVKFLVSCCSYNNSDLGSNTQPCLSIFWFHVEHTTSIKITYMMGMVRPLSFLIGQIHQNNHKLNIVRPLSFDNNLHFNKTIKSTYSFNTFMPCLALHKIPRLKYPMRPRLHGSVLPRNAIVHSSTTIKKHALPLPVSNWCGRIFL